MKFPSRPLCKLFLAPEQNPRKPDNRFHFVTRISFKPFSGFHSAHLVQCLRQHFPHSSSAEQEWARQHWSPCLFLLYPASLVPHTNIVSGSFWVGTKGVGLDKESQKTTPMSFDVLSHECLWVSWESPQDGVCDLKFSGRK